MTKHTGTLSLKLVSSEPAAPAEEWRPIPEAQGLYNVSSLGRVRSEPIQTSSRGRRRGRVLKCSPDSKGYPQFRMCLRDGRKKTMKVHRAVAMAFLGPRPAGHQINHRSGDKFDNSVGNLEYVTCRRNVRHAWQNGLSDAEHSKGERNASAKLTAQDVRLIRDLAPTTSLSRLAARFGVTKQNLRYVINRETWKHVA